MDKLFLFLSEAINSFLKKFVTVFIAARKALHDFFERLFILKSRFRLWERIRQVGPSLLTGLAAFTISFYTLLITRNQMRIGTSVTVIQINQEVTRFIVEKPDYWKYFNIDPKKSPDEQKEWKQKMLRDYKERESRGDHQLIAICEYIADGLDAIYSHRMSIDAEEWNLWWSYICDAYDDSLVLQEYLRDRPGWYALDKYLAPEKGKRKSLYRSTICDYLPITLNEGYFGDKFPRIFRDVPPEVQ
jgi:hypothetical protein